MIGRALALLTLLIAAPALAQVALAPSAYSGQAFGHYRPAPQFSERVSQSLYLPLRDGVRVAMRIDRPAVNGVAAEGRFPVIWHHSLSISQTRADGTGDRVTDYRRVQELTAHGYIVVQVARRGNGQSFGAMRGYHDRNEAYDAFEITQWLARQPWSTGKVGVYGCSNTGDAAMHALTVRPPALAAVFAGCFSWHKYDAFRRGGIFAQWGTGPARTIEQDMAQDPVDGDEQKLLLAEAARQHRDSTPLAQMWRELPLRDSFSPAVASRFWEEGSIARYAEQIRLAQVPVYIQGAWFDELRDQGIAAQLNIPGARLLIGPWDHCNNPGFALLEEMHRFFDRHLKGIDSGIDAQPPIHYFTMQGDGGEWRATDRWPVAGAERTQLLLGNGTLASRPQAPWRTAFRVNHGVVCPNSGSGSRAQPCHVAGAGPAFAGPVLRRSVEVTGEPLLSLWVVVEDGADANLFAYLEDVAPDGSVRVITEGRQKLSLRRTAPAPWLLPAGVPWHPSTADSRQPVVPGEVMQVEFAMMPTSHVFQPGHRIQLSVTGADWRERERDPAAPPLVALLGGEGRESALSLPVVD